MVETGNGRDKAQGRDDGDGPPTLRFEALSVHTDKGKEKYRGKMKRTIARRTRARSWGSP